MRRALAFGVPEALRQTEADDGGCRVLAHPPPETFAVVVALRASNGNKSAAARTLGIGRRTLYACVREFRVTESERAAFVRLGMVESMLFEVLEGADEPVSERQLVAALVARSPRRFGPRREHRSMFLATVLTSLERQLGDEWRLARWRGLIFLRPVLTLDEVLALEVERYEAKLAPTPPEVRKLNPELTAPWPQRNAGGLNVAAIGTLGDVLAKVKLLEPSGRDVAPLSEAKAMLLEA